MKTVGITDSTYRALELASRLTGMTLAQVIERLVIQSTAPAPQETPDDQDTVRIYALYNGRRVDAEFDPTAKSITIKSGPLAGERYKTPSSAARAVITSERPDVDSNRNGWTFWLLDDNSERPLKTIR